MKNANFKIIISAFLIIMMSFSQLAMGMGSDYANQSGSWNRFGWYKPGMEAESQAVAAQVSSIPQSAAPSVWKDYVPTWNDRIRYFGYQYIKDPAIKWWHKGQDYAQQAYDTAKSALESAYYTARGYGRAAQIDAYNTAQNVYNSRIYQWAKQNPGYILLGVAIVGSAVVGAYYLSRTYATKEKINEAKMYIELRNQLVRTRDRLINVDVININEVDTIKNVFFDNLRTIEHSFPMINVPKSYTLIKNDMNIVFDAISEFGIKGNEEDLTVAFEKLIKIVDQQLEKFGVKFERK